MRVVVTGSRGWTDYGTIWRRLSELPAGTEVIHGDSRGADRLADAAAKSLGLPVLAVPAEWERAGYYVPTAGLERNNFMLDLGPDLGSHSGTARARGRVTAARAPSRATSRWRR